MADVTALAGIAGHPHVAVPFLNLGPGVPTVRAILTTIRAEIDRRRGEIDGTIDPAPRHGSKKTISASNVYDARNKKA